ncbi:hypothetical protein ACFYTQ_26460 [Nocardia sp. NPDC004068]|uniref:hypothetical protein n=1 Tax=Nocardia sp. NPDC004068 TaxID=3364303 RepID=UPI003694FCA6
MPTAATISDLPKIIDTSEPWITSDLCQFAIADAETRVLLEVVCPAWNCQGTAPVVGNRIGNHQRNSPEFQVVFGPCQWIGTQIVHMTPVVQSRPGPLPNASDFLAVLNGHQQPDTPMFALAVAMRDHWTHTIDAYTRTGVWNPAQLRQVRLFSDYLTAEVAAVLADGPTPEPDTPTSGIRYGDEISDLTRLVVLAALTEKSGEPLDKIQTMITNQTEFLNRAVDDIRRGEKRLTTTQPYPKRPEGGDGIAESTGSK